MDRIFFGYGNGRFVPAAGVTIRKPAQADIFPRAIPGPNNNLGVNILKNLRNYNTQQQFLIPGRVLIYYKQDNPFPEALFGPLETDNSLHARQNRVPGRFFSLRILFSRRERLYLSHTIQQTDMTIFTHIHHHHHHFIEG